jgi:transposase
LTLSAAESTLLFRTKAYRPYLPNQLLLLPPSLQDWLPEKHLVYFVGDVVNQLDLSGIESYYEKQERGQPPYHPQMMTRILVYGTLVQNGFWKFDPFDGVAG